ncbi:MAG: SAF domain-containing protein [Anaerolineales bacterium]|jgi:pilus assembly protein CpaB
MRRGRILILFALILLFGAVAGFLVLSRLGSGGGTSPSPESTQGPAFGGEAQIVIAAQDISRGAVIPQDGVILSPFPADFVVETMITDLNQVVGHRARMDIARGVPVTQNMVTEQSGDLLGTGSDASLAIPPGYTAITIPLDRFSSVGYALADGDSVDVIVNMLMVDIDPDFQTNLPNQTEILLDQGGVPASGVACDTLAENNLCTSEKPLPYGRLDTEESSGIPLYVVPSNDQVQRPRLVSQRLISNARVLHVGEFKSQAAQPTPVPDQGAGAPAQQQAVATVVAPPSLISLIVTPQDALSMEWALNAGANMTLTLRGPGDTTDDTTSSVTLQFLIDNYDIAVPSKLPYGLEPVLQAPSRNFDSTMPGKAVATPSP